jgi:hypothetical protein
LDRADRYAVFLWDHEAGASPDADEVPLWGLRPILRALQGRGYDDVSVLVERLVPPGEAPRA